MLKCPSCAKRVLGQDLVSGICSHCGARLGGSIDSAVLPSGESHQEPLGSIKPSDLVNSPPASDDPANLDKTFVSNSFASDSHLSATIASHISEDSPEDAPEDAQAGDVSQTFVSNDFTQGSWAPDDQGDDASPGGQTIVMSDREDEDAVTIDNTYVNDSSEGYLPNPGVARTIVADEAPELLAKTLESVWGPEDELEDANTSVTMKAREQSPPPQETKRTLVIKTKSLVQQVQGTNVGHAGGEPEYELLRVLGEGGMGVVYDARQTSIDRNVALKMIKGEAATNARQKAKFLAEVVVTGDLDHPNIVPIYDVGANAQGNLFYSMKKVQGTPWEKVLDQKSLSENLDILLRTADAVGFAHARGVVHRDLKPENIMLGEFGEVLVMDWGLAHPLKGFRKSHAITGSVSMGGTPAYMAPEMATGPIEKITPASDIYLLGGILYEILTGSAPHSAKSLMKCLMAAARNEIVPTQKTGELIDIALKALATDPKDRHQDVKEFQSAIRDYQSHSESVLLSSRAEDDLKLANSSDDYQHYSRALFGFQEAYELWSANRRAQVGISHAKLAYAGSAKRKGDYDLGVSLLDADNPEHKVLRRQLVELQNERVARQRRLVFLKRAAMGLVAMVFVIVTGSAVWIRQEQQKAVMERDRANSEADRAKFAENVAVEQKKLAQGAAEEEKKAKELAIRSEQDAVKQREVAEVQRQIAVAERMKAEEAQKLEEQAKVAAIASEKVAVVEREKAEQAKQKEEYESYISKIGLAASQIEKNAFDPARKVLESCKPELQNWEWGRLQHLCSQHLRVFPAQSPLESLTIDPTGQRFASGGWNGLACIWDQTTGQLLTTLKHGGEYVNAVAFSPDGQYLATGSDDPAGYIQIWSISTGQRVKVIPGHGDEVLSLTYSRDGQQLLSSSYDKTARLWDVESGQEIRKFVGHTWWVWSAMFSPNEQQIVTAGQDGIVIVWDVKTDQRTPAFTGHQGPVFCASFSPDGKQVASAGYDRRLLLWKPADLIPIDFKNLTQSGDVRSNVDFKAFEGHTDAVRSAVFSDDGTLLLSGSQDNTVRVWEIATGQMLRTFRGHGGRVQAAVFLPKGDRILSASHDQTVREWSIDKYEEIRTLQGVVLNGHTDAVLDATFSADQTQIVTASRDRTARLWNTSTGQPGLTLSEGHSYLASTAIFFPGGKKLLTAAVDNTARIWDVTTGGQIQRLDHSGRSAAATVSSNARWVATGSDDKSAILWDATTGTRLKKLEAHQSEVTAVAFSPNDLLLATGDTKGHVKLWNVEAGRVVANLDGHSRRISAIRFSNDGTRVLTASGDNTVGQWDVTSGKELDKLILKHPDAVLALQNIPGSNQVVTSCADQKLRIWDTSTAQVVQTIGPLPGNVFSVSVSDDGRRLLVANSDERTVRLWDLTSGQEIESPQSNGKLGPLIDMKLRGGLLWSTAFVPGSDDVLTVGGSDSRLWDAKTGREKMSFSPHGAVASAAFSPAGDMVVTGSWDNSAKVWDTKTGKVIRKLEGEHTSFVNTATFSNDGEFVLTASDDGTAKVWRLATGNVELTLKGHTDRVRSASYSPSGEFIVTTSSDQTARLWNASTGEFIREFRGHHFAVLCAEFSGDNLWLITGGEDTTAIVWDVKSAKNLQTLGGHSAAVTAAAFSPDKSRVITGSQDQTAKLWDSRTGKEILTLSRHTEDVTSVAFSPKDGFEILTASRDGTAVIWPTAKWTAIAEADTPQPASK